MKSKILITRALCAILFLAICSACIDTIDEQDLKKPSLTARVGTQVLICPPELIENGNVIRIYDEIDEDVVGVQFTFVDPKLQMGFLINNYFAKNARSNSTTITDVDDAFDSNLDNWGVGQLNTNLNLGINSNYYQSHSSRRGQFVITNLDETHKVMSGNFEFIVYEITNPQTGGVELVQGGESYRVSGEFENIPLSDGYVEFFKNMNASSGSNGNNGGNSGNNGGSSGNNNDGNAGGNSGTGANTSITFKNNSFTTMEINFGGTVKMAAAGASVVFMGSATSRSNGEAITSGKTSNGTQVGLQIKWPLDYSFPPSGNLTVEINVPAAYFFVYITNNASSNIQKVYVNYGLQSQTEDNIMLPGNGTRYNIGYYKVWTNSNVRVESSDKYWYWGSLTFPYKENQSVSLVINN